MVFLDFLAGQLDRPSREKPKHRASSDPARKPRSSGSSRSSRSSTSSCKALIPADLPQPRADDLTAVAKNVDTEINNETSMILAVVSQDDQQILQGLKRTYPNFEVCSPGTLMTCIAHLLKRHKGHHRYLALHLIVSGRIDALYFDLADVSKTVYITPVSGWDAPLKIAAASKYHGVRTYAWDGRGPGHREYNLTMREGCFHNPAELEPEELDKLISQGPLTEHQLRGLGTLSKVEQDKILLDFTETSNMARAFKQQEQAEGPTGGIGESNEESQNPAWLTKFLAVLAGICATGAVGMAAFSGCICGITKAGFFIKGPWGLGLSIGYYHSFFGAVAGVTAGTALATAAGVAAGSVVYFVPWSRVYEWVGLRCRTIWDKIFDLLSYLWEKLMEWAAMTGSAFKSVLYGAPQKPHFGPGASGCF